MEGEQLEAYVLERLADGDLLAEIAVDTGIKRTTLYMQFQRGGDEKRDAYMRAREEGLLARGETLRSMARKVLPTLASGGIDPAAVAQLRLAIDTEKWTLAKLLASVFGDKVEQKHTGSIGLTMQATPEDEAL